MIYVCIVTRNNATTVGLLLWKIRQVFGPSAREYQLLVADQRSTDDTPEVLQRYLRALPLTVVDADAMGSAAAAYGALLREAARRSDRHRRDAAVVIPADFSVSPEGIPELVRRLESGADLVVGERSTAGWPLRWRLLARFTARLLQPGVRVAGVADFLSGCLAVRLIAARSALQSRNGLPFLESEGVAARAELVARLASVSRQVTVATLPGAAAALPRSRSTLGIARDLRRLGGRLRFAVLALAAAAGTAVAAGQQGPAPASLREPRSWVGERLRYDARFGIINIGGAELSVAGLDTLQGTDALHVRFVVDGGNFLYQLHNEWDSWIALDGFTSRRFVQDHHEGGRHYRNAYDIFPDSGFYRQEGVDTTLATSRLPLDDAAFFYFIRTVPLEPGQRYEFDRYFKPDRNPVILEVVGRDTLDVPAGRFDCLLLRPIIKGGGIFREKADGRIWVSNDKRRLVVQIKSRFYFGSLTFRLTDAGRAGEASP